VSIIKIKINNLYIYHPFHGRSSSLKGNMRKETRSVMYISISSKARLLCTQPWELEVERGPPCRTEKTKVSGAKLKASIGTGSWVVVLLAVREEEWNIAVVKAARLHRGVHAGSSWSTCRQHRLQRDAGLLPLGFSQLGGGLPRAPEQSYPDPDEVFGISHSKPPGEWMWGDCFNKATPQGRGRRDVIKKLELSCSGWRGTRPSQLSPAACQWAAGEARTRRQTDARLWLFVPLRKGAGLHVKQLVFILLLRRLQRLPFSPSSTLFSALLSQHHCRGPLTPSCSDSLPTASCVSTCFFDPPVPRRPASPSASRFIPLFISDPLASSGHQSSAGCFDPCAHSSPLGLEKWLK